ncbi:mitochondrial outer membrane translocase complex, subunit Tom5 [Hypoxylon sp. FL1284]|nr:mitochondrial outer membrane translocase complex, subunit Tom5 [Hypoxylon sp. FL1284]
MFGGFAPPSYTKEEIEAQEIEAMSTVRYFLATAATLYFAPFAIDAVSSLL